MFRLVHRKNVREEDFGFYVCFVYTTSAAVVSKEGHIAQSCDKQKPELSAKSGGHLDKLEGEYMY